MNYITCFTGHRPKAFPWGTDKNDPRCQILFRRLEDAIDDLIAKGCKHFIAGNAPGTLLITPCARAKSSLLFNGGI